MWNETKSIIQNLDDFLPLENYGNIIEANALKIDWAILVKPEELNFITGNPPFRGARVMDSAQKSELNEIFKDWKNAGNLDYVSCWYKKSADFMKENSEIRSALVSTNSVCQGDSVATLWKPLFDDGIKINFAWRTFKWDSEAKEKAHVHVVIVGFSLIDSPVKKIFDGEKIIEAENINAYLVDAPNVFVEARSKPILPDVPILKMGNMAQDDGNLILNPEERDELIKNNPDSAKFIKRFMMGNELINNVPRYCLWLVDAKPDELRKCPQILERVAKVKEFRRASKREATRKLADSPRLFGERVETRGNYIAIPVVSSENRDYIPIGLLDDSVIPGNKLFVIPDATLYHFGILTSAWMRLTAGRMKSDYSYSKTIVYNNFPWLTFGHGVQKLISKIESTAKKILEAREKFPESSLADLYDPLTMPEELLKAHKANDAAVCEAYGFDKNISEEEIVSALMNLYEKISKE